MRVKTTVAEAEAFKKYLETAGAEIFTPTNPYEWIRFRANGEISIIYQNGEGVLTSFMGRDTLEIYKKFKKSDMSWSGTSKVKRITKNIVIRSLAERDGQECFYCGKEMKVNTETLEHLLPINKGGNNHMANLALCHEECNKRAGHMDVVAKIKLRDNLRSEK